MQITVTNGIYSDSSYYSWIVDTDSATATIIPDDVLYTKYKTSIDTDGWSSWKVFTPSSTLSLSYDTTDPGLHLLKVQFMQEDYTLSEEVTVYVIRRIDSDWQHINKIDGVDSGIYGIYKLDDSSISNYSYLTPSYVPHSDYYYSYYTQKIANHFPEWSKVRKEVTSNGQQFISGISPYIEDIRVEEDIISDNQYLATARLDEISEVFKLVRPSGVSMQSDDNVIIIEDEAIGVKLWEAEDLSEFYDALPNRAAVTELGTPIIYNRVAASGSAIDLYTKRIESSPEDIGELAFLEERPTIWQIDNTIRSLDNGCNVLDIASYKNDIWLLTDNNISKEIYQVSKRTTNPEPDALKIRRKLDITVDASGYDITGLLFDEAGDLYLLDPSGRAAYSVDLYYDTFLVDRTTSTIFFRDEYLDGVYVYPSGNAEKGNIAIPEHQPVWNAFDEFGFLLGLDRIPKELNSDYKDRLFDVYENPADSTEQGMINGVVRELGIKKLVEDYDDSDATSILASGYGVRINVLNDETYTDDQLNSNNNALGTYLEEAVTKLDDIGSILWNKATFDLSFTDVISEEYTGLAYLPNLYDADASGFTLIQYSNGVGDLNDLKIVEADGIDPSYVQVAGYSTEDLPFRLNGLSDDNESRIDDIYWFISEDMYDNYYDVAGNPAGGTLAGLSEAFNIFLYDSEGNYIT